MASRTLFFHIGTAMQVLFYLLAALSSGICLYGFLRRYLLWKKGKPAPQTSPVRERLRALFSQAILQKRVRRRAYAGSLHAALFFGLGALFTGTVIVAIEHYGALLFGPHWLYRGWFYLLCKLTLDLAGAFVLLAAALAFVRRFGPGRPAALANSWQDGAFLGLLFIATLTGFMLEAAGIAGDPSRAPYALFSPIGGIAAAALKGLSPAMYALIWWIHIPLVLTVIAVLPYGRWLHLFVIPFTVLRQPDRAMGALEPVSMADVEETGRIGLGSVADFDSWQLMSLDGCMGCGRCTDVCPAHAAGKELDPKQVVLDLRALMQAGAGASTDTLSDASIWACTNCHACVRECPALIRHVDIIDGIRRYRVAEGRVAGSAAAMLRQLDSRENPWGLPADQRMEWASGLDIAAAAKDDGREVLLWVGCAGAYDPTARQTTRALARLLTIAGVKFSVLGRRERCTGDPARRTGDEFLFQRLAETNVETLNSVGASLIVTQCPHCMHTLKNEYHQFGGEYTVMHHSQFLAKLLDEKRLDVPSKLSSSLTYHDPCFLGRVNRITDEPRQVLARSTQMPVVEVERRESRTFCCGAGGGRMWMEDAPSERPGRLRAQELAATGAGTIAVGCPFCRVMIGDSVSQLNIEGAPGIMDIAEILLAAADSQDDKLKESE